MTSDTNITLTAVTNLSDFVIDTTNEPFATYSIIDPYDKVFNKLETRISQIEKRLNILQPNPKLESQWKRLTALREEYEKVEQELLDKQSMWDTLKGVK